jgi:predicted lipid carrier protein YhbT
MGMAESPTAADTLGALDFAAMSPQEFARLVKDLPARDLAAAFRGELRLRALREIFSRMERQFRPEAAGSLRALIRWKVEGEAGDGVSVFETSIADGRCVAREGASDEQPRVTLALADAEFLKLVSGNGNPVTMFVLRKIKIGGDVGLAAGLTRLFDIPKA